MKFIFSLVLGLLMAWSSPAQSFNKAKGSATDISISKSGEVFAVGTSKQIFKYYFDIEEFKLHSVANRNAKTIAAAQEKFVYLLTRDGRMHITYATNKNRIGPIGSLTLKDIYVGKNNALWGIDSKGAVKRYNSNWQSFSIAGTNNKKVCVNNSGRVFTLKNDNTIHEYHNGRSKKLPGGGTDIAYDHAQQKLYVLGTSKRIFVWNPGKGNWDLVNNTRNDFRSIAAHKGKLWGTTTRNEIYTTANINGSTSNSADSYKLKITLTSLKCEGTWDSDYKDDYLLKFVPTLKINGREQTMKNKKYGRIGNLIKKYGPASALYVHRSRGQKDHDAVQIHAREHIPINIANSGVYEIPKNRPITDSAFEFNLSIIVDEVSKEIVRLRQENLKLNTKEIVNYLLKKTNKGDYQDYENTIKKDMGIGYQTMILTTKNGKRVVSDILYASDYEFTSFGSRRTGVGINYTIELVD